MLEQYAPPSVVVNEAYEIVHLSENAGRFLRLGGGEPSYNLLKVIHPDLRLELRTALFRATQKGRESVVSDVPVTLDSEPRRVSSSGATGGTAPEALPKLTMRPRGSRQSSESKKVSLPTPS